MTKRSPGQHHICLNELCMPTTFDMFSDAQVVFLEFIKHRIDERKIIGNPRMMAEAQIVQTMKDICNAFPEGRSVGSPMGALLYLRDRMGDLKETPDDKDPSFLENILRLAEKWTAEDETMFALSSPEEAESFAENIASTVHYPTSLAAAQEYAQTRMAKKAAPSAS